VDDEMVRRHLSIDFSLPKQFLTPLRVKDGQPVYFIPLAMLPRDTFPMHLDIRSDTGDAIPMLNGEESIRITSEVLSHYARDILDKKVIRRDETIESALAYIPRLPYKKNVSYLRALLNPDSDEWARATMSVAARNALRQDSKFVDLLSLCASSTFVIVPVTDCAGHRHIVKLSYEEEINPKPYDIDLEKDRRSFWQKKLQSLGWVPMPVSIRILDLGGAGTSHIQVVTPENVLLAGSDVVATRPKGQLSPRVLDKKNPPRVYEAGKDDEDRRIHFYLRNTREIASGTLRVGLIAERKGLFFGSVIAAGVLAAMMVFCYLRAETFIGLPNGFTSLVLITPGLVAIYLVRPGEHALARRLRVPLRAALTLATGLTFATAVGFLGYGPRQDPRIRLQARLTEPITFGHTTPDLGVFRGILLASAVGTTLIFVFLLVSYKLRKPLGDG
jgi:hypothetical protein